MVKVYCNCVYADCAQIVLQMTSQCHIRGHFLLLSRQTPTQTSFWLSTFIFNFLCEEGNLICSKSSAAETSLLEEEQKVDY